MSSAAPLSQSVFHTALIEALPALRPYAFGLCRDHTKADDLVQDCLERALTKRAQFNVKPSLGIERSVMAWLRTMLRNIFLDQYRQSQRRGQHQDLDSGLGDAALASAPRQEASLKMRDLTRALATLNASQRRLVIGAGYHGYDYQTLSKSENLPVGTVRSRLSRARQRLRADMEAAPTVH